MHSYLPLAAEDRGSNDENAGVNLSNIAVGMGATMEGMDSNKRQSGGSVVVGMSQMDDAFASTISTVPVPVPASRTQTQNNSPVPISRPPTKPRDGLFAVAFLAHFVVVGLLGFVKTTGGLEASVILYSVAGSWSSMTMIVILLGGSFGIMVCALIASGEWRETVLSLGILLSITMQACLGNVLLLLQSRYSFLGIFILASALLDSCSYKKARENMSFTSALIQMVVEIFKAYGLSLAGLCVGVIVIQTCTLLWWGAFFVDLISNVSTTYAEYLIVLMALSLYWIASFFHALMSYLVGGCVLWYFVRPEGDRFAPAKRVMLHLHCGMTTSLGSICKGALFCPLADRVLAVHNWSSRSTYSRGSAVTNFFKNAALTLTNLLVREARRFHRLTFCLTATYGRTLCKAAEEQLLFHPETIDISIEDNTAYILAATATELAGLVSIVFGVVAERRQGDSWPLFFFVCFCLSYCGLSLAIHAYSSAVDAIIVAFAATPEKFARENQIVFLRFIRHTETGLR